MATRKSPKRFGSKNTSARAAKPARAPEPKVKPKLPEPTTGSPRQPQAPKPKSPKNAEQERKQESLANVERERKQKSLASAERERKQESLASALSGVAGVGKDLVKGVTKNMPGQSLANTGKDLISGIRGVSGGIADQLGKAIAGRNRAGADFRPVNPGMSRSPGFDPDMFNTGMPSSPGFDPGMFNTGMPSPMPSPGLVSKPTPVGPNMPPAPDYNAPGGTPYKKGGKVRGYGLARGGKVCKSK